MSAERPVARRGRARRPAAARSPVALAIVPSLHRATHRIGLWLDRHGAGVTQAEGHVLAALAGAETRTVGELHRDLAHRRSTLTSVLDRLESRGLVTRSVAAADRRSFEVRLTPAGRVVATRTLAALASLERDVVEALGVRGAARFAALLDRIAR